IPHREGYSFDVSDTVSDSGRARMTDRFRMSGGLAALLLVLAGAGCSAPEPGIARGEDVWETCVPCHGSSGEGNQALGAPAIAGLPQWHIQAQLESFASGWRG